MKRTALLSAALVAFALPLSAQDTATAWTPGQTFLTNWDYDGDGTVTLDEVKERRGDLFASFDADEDGFLTPEEFAAHDQMREAMQDAREMPDMDQMMQGQGRGMGWGGQPGQGRGQGFGRGPWAMQGPGMQGPGWGYGPQAMPQRGWGYGPQGGQPGFGPQGGPRGFGRGFGPQGGMMPGGPMPGGPQSAGQELAMLDADGDGKVSLDEFVSAGDAWFARFDRTGDGAVTVDDFGPGRR